MILIQSLKILLGYVVIKLAKGKKFRFATSLIEEGIRTTFMSDKKVTVDTENDKD